MRSGWFAHVCTVNTETNSSLACNCCIYWESVKSSWWKPSLLWYQKGYTNSFFFFFFFFFFCFWACCKCNAHFCLFIQIFFIDLPIQPGILAYIEPELNAALRLLVWQVMLSSTLLCLKWISQNVCTLLHCMYWSRPAINLQNDLHPWYVYMYFVYSNYAIFFAEIINSQYARP